MKKSGTKPLKGRGSKTITAVTPYKTHESWVRSRELRDKTLERCWDKQHVNIGGTQGQCTMKEFLVLVAMAFENCPNTSCPHNLCKTENLLFPPSTQNRGGFSCSISPCADCYLKLIKWEISQVLQPSYNQALPHSQDNCVELLFIK